MLETESQGVVGRLHDLERRVLEQGDELVCLKATLAEALRRLSVVEGMRLPYNTYIPQASSQPVTPVRNGLYKDHIRLRQANFSSAKINSNANDTPSKSYSGSALPQRRSVQYQSTGSLHSDSLSSTSVSPIPSPSPRATPLPMAKKPLPIIVNNNQASSNGLHKRWSSTGDFNTPSSPQSRFSTKSFLNLFARSCANMSNLKHGTKDVTYNDEEQTLRMFLRGRPITLYPPSEIANNYDISKVTVAPSQKLQLDWVYGYRGRDCRSNLYMMPTGEMVYFVAGVVVLYNIEEQTQRHYLGHTDDVKSLAIHPNKLIVATGQCAGHERREGKAHVRVWNSVSLHTLAVVGLNDFEVSVCCLSFSKADSGALLLVVDEASDHTISVWDWQKGEHGYKVTEAKCSVDTVVAAEFHPLDRNAIVTCGKSHIAFWTLDSNGGLYKRMGIFEGRDKPKYILCVSFLQSGDIITGDSNGNLIVWGRGTNTIVKFNKNVHEGPVFSICVLKDGGIVTGGGKDGKVVRFDSSLTKNEGETQVEGHFGGIRAVSEGRGSQLLVGTTRNCILTGAINLGFQPVILGHVDELWGLAAHPMLPQFASAGYDKLLQMWDSMSHSILWSKDIGEPAQSLAFFYNGNVIAVGCITGLWMVFDSQTRELVSNHTDGVEPIQVIQYSPDGTMIALGSRDNHIYIYQVTEDGYKYTRLGRCLGHSSFITHMDWSKDSQIIRSNSGDYELLYWNAATCRQIPQSSALRDTHWASQTCTISSPTVGIWPENADGTDVNYCDASHDLKLMATGDDFGKVRLYSFPVIQPKSLSHTYAGHSSHVTSVNFLHDDSRLVSIGGKDTSVMQWAIL